jgi:hypothetical protein
MFFHARAETTGVEVIKQLDKATVGEHKWNRPGMGNNENW